MDEEKLFKFVESDITDTSSTMLLVEEDENGVEDLDVDIL